MLSALGLALLCPALAHADAIDYGTAGGTYAQNFDSLGTTTKAWANGTTLTGWHWLTSTGGTSFNNNVYPEDGDPAAGRVLSLGNNDGENASDRAFGTQNSNGVEIVYFGAQLQNTTGGTLDSFTLAYIGEQWRAVGAEGQDKLTFEYQIFASGGSILGTTGWTNVAELDFNAPRTVGSSTKLVGNDSANRASITSTVSGITWGAGQELWLRWSDENPVNNNAAGGSLRAMMGIDDLNFSATTAIPEPGASALLLGALALGFTARRRSRRS
ncbi:MAG: PEP-CTERM sorting domain-containing protein [Verrucomicrobiota bacterium]